MHGLGTIANAGAIVIGGLLGLALKKGLKPRFQEMLMQIMGICVMFLGIAGALTGLLEAGLDGELTTRNSMLLIGSMVLGGLLGEWINIAHALERFGDWLKVKARSTSDPHFTEAFVTASLVVCVGAMAVVGSIQDGLLGDASLLYAKAVLDCVIIFVFASAHGKGAVFSAVPVAIFQGAVTLLAGLLSPLFSPEVIAAVSFVGSVLIFCVGTNLCLNTKFSVANMLPALLFAGLAVGIF